MATVREAHLVAAGATLHVSNGLCCKLHGLPLLQQRLLLHGLKLLHRSLLLHHLVLYQH